jgi:FKBP-type peptidyl-prolyl cis-trans isomerase SlpA
MPLGDFTDAKPELDQIMTFSLPDGEETMGVIREITDTHAMVDFNHPLAGQEVVFTVKILDVGLPDPTMIQDSIEN